METNVDEIKRNEKGHEVDKFNFVIVVKDGELKPVYEQHPIYPTINDELLNLIQEIPLMKKIFVIGNYRGCKTYIFGGFLRWLIGEYIEHGKFPDKDSVIEKLGSGTDIDIVININRKNKDITKRIFDELHKDKMLIEFMRGSYTDPVPRRGNVLQYGYYRGWLPLGNNNTNQKYILYDFICDVAMSNYNMFSDNGINNIRFNLFDGIVGLTVDVVNQFKSHEFVIDSKRITQDVDRWNVVQGFKNVYRTKKLWILGFKPQKTEYNLKQISNTLKNYTLYLEEQEKILLMIKNNNDYKDYESSMYCHHFCNIDIPSDQSQSNSEYCWKMTKYTPQRITIIEFYNDKDIQEMCRYLTDNWTNQTEYGLYLKEQFEKYNPVPV